MTEQDVNWKDSAIIEEQVENLLQHLILEEKIKLSGQLAVDDSGSAPALPDDVKAWFIHCGYAPRK